MKRVINDSEEFIKATIENYKLIKRIRMLEDAYSRTEDLQEKEEVNNIICGLRTNPHNYIDMIIVTDGPLPVTELRSKVYDKVKDLFIQKKELHEAMQLYLNEGKEQ